MRGVDGIFRGLHTTYVALSRHRQSADVYWSKDEFKSYQHLSQNLARRREKDFTLDYTERRGFRAFLDKMKLKAHECLLASADDEVDFKPPNTKHFDKLTPELKKLVLKEAHYKANQDNPAEAIKQGDFERFVHEYKLMVIRRHNTTETHLAQDYDKKLDKLATYAHKQADGMKKVYAVDPKIGQLIQSRIEKLKTKEKDQGIER